MKLYLPRSFTCDRSQLLHSCHKAEDWKDNPRTQQWAKRKYETLLQTQIAEDGFQRERRKETTSCAKVFNETTAWYTLIKRNVLGKVHRFKNIRLQPFRRGVKKLIDKKQRHRPHSTKPWKQLRKVVTEASTAATWWTCTSSSWNRPFAHLVLQRYCLTDTQWPQRVERVSLCWLCCIFNRANLLVREVGTEMWYFALGTIAETVGIGWPAQPVKDASGVVIGYLPQKEMPKRLRDLVKFLPVTRVWPLSETEYEAMPFAAQGPMASAIHRKLSQGGMGSSSSSSAASMSGPWPGECTSGTTRPGIIAVPKSRPEAVLKAAARTCFAEWGVGLLKQLAAHIGVEVGTKDKLFQVLTKLLNFILNPLSEEELLEILALREFKKDPLDDILHSEDMVAQSMRTG